jgi:hypothetical protein
MSEGIAPWIERSMGIAPACPIEQTNASEAAAA